VLEPLPADGAADAPLVEVSFRVRARYSIAGDSFLLPAAIPNVCGLTNFDVEPGTSCESSWLS
jgi:hypothetical protein